MESIKVILVGLVSLFLAFFNALLVQAQTNPKQQAIDAAMGRSFATQENQFIPVIEELKKSKNENVYWIAYAHLRQSIYLLQINQQTQGEQSIGSAIEMLESIKEKSSEDYALLGQATAFSISFYPQKGPSLGGKAEGYFKRALKLDKSNMRAYVGLGTNNFYKPVAFGGGKRVEEYLNQAIALADQSEENGPSWGKNEAYYILASYYQQKGELDKSKMFVMQGLQNFPGDFRLSELKQSF